jgi:3-hydroxymyristoyl/3-hydroxydecanoyl-(acyl carrier protein) dehydratase
MIFELTVTIPHDHASLTGHFPNNPIVPGVVILGEVLKTLRQRDNCAIKVLGSPSIKFLAPLRPGESMAIRLETSCVGEVMFSCSSHEQLIADGSIEYYIIPTGPNENQ